MDDLEELRRGAFLSRAAACALCRVSVRTWRRWENGETRPPGAVLRLMAVLGGDLAPYGWPGWRMNGGKLWAPDLKGGFLPSDVRSIAWTRILLADYRLRLRIAENPPPQIAQGRRSRRGP